MRCSKYKAHVQTCSILNALKGLSEKLNSTIVIIVIQNYQELSASWKILEQDLSVHGNNELKGKRSPDWKDRQVLTLTLILKFLFVGSGL